MTNFSHELALETACTGKIHNTRLIDGNVERVVRLYIMHCLVGIFLKVSPLSASISIHGER
jgi:hypothetical protein